MVRFPFKAYDSGMRYANQMGTLMCLVHHKWECKRIERLFTVRYVNRCQRCGSHGVSRDPNLFTRRVEEFSGALA